MPDSLEVLALWRQFLVSTLSESSVADYWGAVRRFTFAVPVPVLQVTEDHITGYLGSFPPRSSARVGAYQALRHLFGWLHRRGFVGSDPTEHLRVQAPMERVPVALTEEQLTRLVHAAATRSPHRGYCVALLYYTAARVSEACALRWSDVREGQLRIQGFKGGRERWVPVGPGLRGTLDGLGETGTHRELLIGRSTATLWKWLKDAGEATGIPNVHPHLFRATAATILMRRGARPDVVRLYLGHTNLRTTLRYLAVDQSELADAGALL